MCSMYVPSACGCQKILLTLWDWNYRSLLAAIEMLGNKLGLLQEKKAILTPEPSLQPLDAMSFGVLYIFEFSYMHAYIVCVCLIPSFRKWWWLILNVNQEQLRLRRALQLRSYLDHIGLWVYLWAVVLLTEMWRPTLNMGSTIPWTEP